MPGSILDGLALIDSTGFAILATTVTSLVVGVSANLLIRGRYRSLAADLDAHGATRRFDAQLLDDIVRDAERAASQSSEPNLQAIIEDHFQSGLGTTLLAERFVRAATGLVIILGLLGTFYGLTASIGRLVHLVGGGGTADPTEGVTAGLTQALSGMTVAFSNSLVGIVSAVLLTLFGIVSNPTDQRVALMIKIERYLGGLLASRVAEGGRSAVGSSDRLESFVPTIARLGASMERLEDSVTRFEAALTTFATSTRDFSEFNAHLKDNVQRMSLSFGDLGDALRTEVRTFRQREGR